MDYFLHSIHKEEFLTQESLLFREKHGAPVVIGIPKENVDLEPRLPFTPEGVQILVEAGYEVIMEAGAGAGINYSDQRYSESGAIITNNRATVFNADTLFKIAFPTIEEVDLLKDKIVLFSTLDLRSLSAEIFRAMQRKKITAFNYDFLKDDGHQFSLSNSIAEIEGNVAVYTVSELMSNLHGGKGILLGGVVGVAPVEVCVLGATIAGIAAAKKALDAGCLVKIFDHNVNNLRHAQHLLGTAVYTSVFHPQTLSRALLSADAVIGCLCHVYSKHRYIVSEDIVQSMKKGAVIVDISLNEGGCFETSAHTSLASPYYVQYGVIHCCLPNISAQVARSTSMAMSNILTNEMVRVDDYGGIHNAIKRYRGFRNGVYLYNGFLTSSYVGEYLGTSANDINLLLTAF